MEEFDVANILTRSCKLVPSRPRLEEEQILLAKIVTYTSLQSYKVVLFVQSGLVCLQRARDFEFWVQIFDSVTGSWKTKKLVELPYHNNWTLSSAVYFNGALYMVAGNGTTRLVAFDMEEETLTELNTEALGDYGGPIDGKYMEFVEQLVVCNGNMFAICKGGTFTLGSDIYIWVQKVALSKGRLSIVEQGRPGFFNLTRSNEPVAYGGLVYFWAKDSRYDSHDRILVNDVLEKSWGRLPSCTNGLYTGCCFNQL
ncbi:unnamed protein product [Calypogeia fissa]